MDSVVLLSRSTRPWESMRGHAWTFSEQVIASTIDGSRSAMSDVVFRAAPTKWWAFLFAKNISKPLTALEMVIQVLHFLFFKLLHFSSMTSKLESQSANSSHWRVYYIYKLIWLIFSKTTCNLNIYCKIDPDDILARNDVINCFRLAANWHLVKSQFLDNCSTNYQC